MPDATITSSESTFGTISGTFSADQSTVTGTISGVVTGTLTGSVGVPGPQGPEGPEGPQGPEGPPGEGGTWGSIVGTLSNQTDLQSALDAKQSVSGMSAYLTKADNLGSLTNFATARSNLSLGTLNTPVFAGVTAQGSGSNVANLTPSALSITHSTFGTFTIQPSSGITFPDSTVQTTAFTVAQLSNYLAKASNLSDLPSASTARTNLGLGSLAIVNDAPFDGNQYARKNGAWDIVSSTSPYITSVSSPLSVSGGNLSIDLSAYLLSSTAASTYAVTARGLPSAGTTGQVLTKNSGTNYDVSWATFVPGDRYLTTSTTSLTIGNGTKSLTVGTGLSYTPTQNVTISFDSSKHMHGEVLTYNSGTGAMTVDVNHHTGSGTYSAWVINVGGVTPQTSVAWGDITGTLGSQTDLATALSAKLETSTAAATYQTISGMSAYLTTSAAASTYQTISGMSSYLTTSAAASTYYPLTGNPSGFITSAALSGYATESWVTSQAYLTSADLTGYATESWVGSQGYLTSYTADFTYLRRSNDLSDVSSASNARTNLGLGTMATATATDYLSKAGNLSGLASVSTARTNLGLGTIATVNDAPSDGSQYARKDGAWAVVSSPTQYITSVSSPLSVTSQNLSVDLSAYLTSSTAAATYQTIAGMSSYLTTASAASTYLTQSSAASTYQTQAAMSSYLTTASAASTYAPINSPVFTGDARAVTPATGDNDTSIATTAFVKAQGYLTSAPVTSVAGKTGAVTLAVADVSGAAPTASPALSGTPTAPTASAGTSTTQLATTEFVRTDNNVKVWVNFNGTGTIAIRSSFNVSSITDGGVGTYTVNYTNAISANASGQCLISDDATTYRFVNMQGTATNNTTTSFKVNCFQVVGSSFTQVDSNTVMVTIFR